MIPTLLGIPFDGASSFQRGAALAPAAIRAALHSPSSNSWNEDVVDAVAELNDAGDLVFAPDGDPLTIVESGVAALLGRGATPILLGGDHSITWPILRAVRRHCDRDRLTILHLDAHPDLYDSFEGSRISHACPFARVMEEGLAGRLVQCGIRTLNAHQQEQARRFGIEIVPMRTGIDAMISAAGRVEGSVYLSVDLDVLDPGFAPGLSHPEPGGLSTREVISIVQSVPRGCLIGADIVELNPANDLRDLTARVAAKLVKEIVGRMVGGAGSQQGAVRSKK
jgi:agmatinase